MNLKLSVFLVRTAKDISLKFHVDNLFDFYTKVFFNLWQVSNEV